MYEILTTTCIKREISTRKNIEFLLALW